MRNTKDNIKGNIDLILILPILFILLWGFALCYAYLNEQQKLNQHLWQAGLSQWNKKSFTSYKHHLDHQGPWHLQLKNRKTTLLNKNWFDNTPLPFKLFQQKNRPYHLSLSSNKKNYDFLVKLHEYINSKSKAHIDLQDSILFPDHERRKSSQRLLLKHSLWTQGMCHVGFTETALPLLGIDLLQQTMMGVKLPFSIPIIKHLPSIGCSHEFF
ncbi:hypothetical protein MRY82_08875 [bacterium]|nr:hypothetical protein [bacterium]